MKIRVLQETDLAGYMDAGGLIRHSEGPFSVLFEIGVVLGVAECEDHWLLRDNVEKACCWPRRVGSRVASKLDDADRIVIKKIYTDWYNNVVIVVQSHSRLGEVESMVNGLVEFLGNKHQLEEVSR